MTDKFDTFLRLALKDKGPYVPPKKLIALDPGHTTGAATFIDGMLTEVQQLNTHPLETGIDTLNSFITEDTDIVIYEDYKVYAWKAEDHSWATLHTPQLIGCIRTICQFKDIPYHSQMAQQAKGFCTDNMLKHWEYYSTGLKHGRDAVRHGTYYLLHNYLKDPKKKG